VIKVQIDDKELQTFFHELTKKMGDLTPAFKIVGQIIQKSVWKNFDVGGRYSEVGSWRGGSKKWLPLAFATLISRAGGTSKAFKKGARKKEEFSVEGLTVRARKKMEDAKVLVRHGMAGGLMGSVTYVASAVDVVVGTNKVYAAIHQFGGKAGRGKKVEIPARPYLVVQDEDIEEIKQTIWDYLQVK